MWEPRDRDLAVEMKQQKTPRRRAVDAVKLKPIQGYEVAGVHTLSNTVILFPRMERASDGSG